MKGTVKWFDKDKGFGFICQEVGPDVFVHYSQIRELGYKSLEEGESVSFDLKEAGKGLQAYNVEKIY